MKLGYNLSAQRAALEAALAIIEELEQLLRQHPNFDMYADPDTFIDEVFEYIHYIDGPLGYEEFVSDPEHSDKLHELLHEHWTMGRDPQRKLR